MTAHRDSQEERALHSALSCQGLTIRYGHQTVVENVTFSVRPGSLYALLGRNGAGKSSMIRCLLGQQRPQAGSLRILGLDAWRRRAQAMGRTGVVPERPDAPPALNPKQLGRLCQPLYPRWNEAGYRQRLDRFGVAEKTPFGKLSRGQQTLVQLALALAPAPELLVLDDPTLGLDAVARRDFFQELMGELHDSEATVLLTSHDLEGISRIADRVGILHGGRLQLDEDLDVLKDRFRRIRYGKTPAHEVEGLIEALQPVRRQIGAWGPEAVVARCDAEMTQGLRHQTGGSVEVEPMSLEEIFIAVTGDGGEGGAQ
ncbi:MAG: ABC transporter ATP-binding protein [Acidobacteriota bacterium]|nr:ABC transporter ATP-binding protein [Acidobacteriota bacterium]